MSDRLTVDTITSDQLDELYAERDEHKQNYLNACATIAAMHKAAVGEVRGPNRGVVEDVEDVRLRAEQAEAAIARVRDLADRWAKAGPPPLGTSINREWDRRLVELNTALAEPKEG